MRIIRKDKVLHPDLSYRVTGILFKVRKEQSRHKTERQYCDAIEKALIEAGIEYEREKVLGRDKIDFFIEGKLVLEIKAKPYIQKNDYHQIKRYLEALEIKLGILANMRQYYVHPKRILNKNGKI